MKKTLVILSLVSLFASCSNKNQPYVNGDNRTNTPCDNASTQDSDWQVTTRVKSALMGDNSISASGRMVGVETNSGVVTLTGSVRSMDESRYIEKKVKSIQGVRSVDNQLTLNS